MAKQSSRIWQKRLEELFPAAIKSRGASYYRVGRVSLGSASATEIEALVDGSEEYLVIRLIDDTHQPGGTVRAACECPHAQRGYACKHLWAAILAADAALAKEERAGGSAETTTAAA